jgi:hypothetical protein
MIPPPPPPHVLQAEIARLNHLLNEERKTNGTEEALRKDRAIQEIHLSKMLTSQENKLRKSYRLTGKAVKERHAKEIQELAKEMQELKDENFKETHDTKQNCEVEKALAVEKIKTIEKKYAKERAGHTKEIGKSALQIKELKGKHKQVLAEIRVKTGDKLKQAKAKSVEALEKKKAKWQDSVGTKSIQEKERHWKQKASDFHSELEKERAVHKEQIKKLGLQMKELKEEHKKTFSEAKKKAAVKIAETKTKSKEAYKAKRQELARKRIAANETTTSSPRKRLKKGGSSETPDNKNFRKWMEHYEALKAFKEEFGHCNVPARYTRMKNPDGTVDEKKRKMFNFVTSQRTSHRKLSRGDLDHALTPEKIHLMDGIGFKWKVGPDVLPWEERLQQLVQFSQEHGHCDIPQYCKQRGYDGLGNWVCTQRRIYREGRIEPEKAKQLEELGFKWTLRDRGGTLEERMIKHASTSEHTYGEQEANESVLDANGG